MSNKYIDGELDGLDEALARDLLSPETPIDVVEDYLRAAGAAPQDLRDEGKAFAEELLERRRLSWQERARRKISKRRSLLSEGVRIAKLTRDEMIAALRRDERFAPVFRKRQPGEVSTDELRGFMEELEQLRVLEAAEGQGDNGEDEGA